MTNDASLDNLAERLTTIEKCLTQLSERIQRLEESSASDALIPYAVPLDEEPNAENAEAPKLFEVLKFVTKVVESNSTWAKYAWKLVIKNMADHTLRLEAKTEYLDADDFVVHDETLDDTVLDAYEERVFRGYHLVDEPISKMVKSVSVDVKVSAD